LTVPIREGGVSVTRGQSKKGCKNRERKKTLPKRSGVPKKTEVGQQKRCPLMHKKEREKKKPPSGQCLGC